MQPPDIGFRPTIGDAIKRAAREFGDDDYLVSLDERITYAQADERSAVLARRMLARGIGKGTRVGLLFTYGSEWLLCWLAASRIGAVVEPFSTFYTARELRTALRLGDVDVLIAPPTVLKTDVSAAARGRLSGPRGVDRGPPLADRRAVSAPGLADRGLRPRLGDAFPPGRPRRRR